MNAPLLEAHLRALKLPAALANYRRLAERTSDPVAYPAAYETHETSETTILR